MFTINSKNIMTLTKGDSASFQVNVQLNGKPYTLLLNDEVTFTMRRGMESRINLISKTIRMTDNNTIVINPIDTAKLTVTAQLPIGVSYIYDVQLKLANGEIHTMIPHTPFILDWEVTNG